MRDKLLELVKAEDSNVTNCSEVTTTHLGDLDGTLGLSRAGIATLSGGILRISAGSTDCISTATT